MKFRLTYIIPFLLLAVFFACKKEKFTTAPQVKIKSITPNVVVKGNLITVTASFTDDEGDIQDSVILVFKRYNGSTTLTTDTTKIFIGKLGVPNTRSGEIDVLISYGEIIAGALFLNTESVDREASYGIILKDKGGNRSNYAESKKITLKKP
jgi:hypothetical protein